MEVGLIFNTDVSYDGLKFDKGYENSSKGYRTRSSKYPPETLPSTELGIFPEHHQVWGENGHGKSDSLVSSK